jgi:ABC-type Fe3+/spermidine/putrescine transport system ATPase subunit
MIAGLETPTSGTILSNDRNITTVPARDRNMGMVFQNYALFPHLDVFENVAFGLKTRRLDTSTIRQRVAKALGAVRMGEYERRSVHQLSGGQQQRIALARALAIEPEVLLLDEPLSNLDPSLREDLRDQIRTIIRELGVTTVFVTHDQQEAFALADRVAIMDAGVCRQVGKPADVYNRPADAFVAQFLGKANLLPGALVGLSEDILIVVRPENVILRASPTASGHADGGRERGLDVMVVKAVFEGPIVQYLLQKDGLFVTARLFHHGAATFKPGDSVSLSFPDDRYHVLPKS